MAAVVVGMIPQVAEYDVVEQVVITGLQRNASAGHFAQAVVDHVKALVTQDVSLLGCFWDSHELKNA